MGIVAIGNGDLIMFRLTAKQILQRINVSSIKILNLFIHNTFEGGFDLLAINGKPEAIKLLITP